MIERGALRIEIEPASPEGLVVVRLHGELDMEGAPAVEDELTTLISGGAGDVVVDLSELSFIDSTGIQCLVRAAERAEEDGGALRLRGARGQVEDVIKLTGVGGLLQFSD